MFAPPIWGDVLLRPSSPAPWLSGSGPSHPCAKCGADTAGIAIGGLCASCTRQLERRAGRIARLAAMGTTVPLAADVTPSLPRDPTSRLVGVGGGLLWDVFTVV